MYLINMLFNKILVVDVMLKDNRNVLKYLKCFLCIHFTQINISGVKMSDFMVNYISLSSLIKVE